MGGWSRRKLPCEHGHNSWSKSMKPRSCISCIEFANENTVLPPGTRIKSASSHGISAWSKTAKLNVVLQDGSPRDYFLKVTLRCRIFSDDLAAGEKMSADSSA